MGHRVTGRLKLSFINKHWDLKNQFGKTPAANVEKLILRLCVLSLALWLSLKVVLSEDPFRKPEGITV